MVHPAAMLALLGVLAIDLVAPDGTLAGLAAAVAAGLVVLPLACWRGWQTLDQPILWVLHLAYLMVAVALAAKAWTLLLAPDVALSWLHLQTAGAIGTMVLAVMTRAALGHTGRELRSPRAVVAAYLLAPLAAASRASAAALDDPMLAHAAAALCWTLARALFLWCHAPILVLARADGKPG